MWHVAQVERETPQKASVIFTHPDGRVLQVDLRVLDERKIIVEAEDLIAGHGKGFYLEDQAMTAVLGLPKPKSE